MAIRPILLLFVFALSACPAGPPEPVCLYGEGACEPDYPDGGYSPTGCGELDENYLPSAWPRGTGTVPRNLHVFSGTGDFALTGPDAGELLARYRGKVGAFEVHGNYQLLVYEATPFEEEAPFQTAVAAVLPQGAEIEVHANGDRVGRFTADGVDLVPPAAPTVELIEVMPERRNCVFGARYRVNREPDTLLLVRRFNPDYSGYFFDWMALTEGDEVQIADTWGGHLAYEFVVLDKAGNRSEPLLVTVPLGEREESPSPDILWVYGVRRTPVRTGTRLLVYAGHVSSNRYPITAVEVAPVAGECSAAAAIRPDGRVDLDVQSTSPGSCELEVSVVARGATTTGRVEVFFEDAVPLVATPADPPCADGTPLRWPVGSTTACRAPGAPQRLRFGTSGSPGSEVEVGGSVVATLDADHLLVCEPSGCAARDETGALQSSVPLPASFGFPTDAYLSNRLLSPHAEAPRLLAGRLEHDGLADRWYVPQLRWSGTELSTSELDAAPGSLTDGVWAGRWRLVGPDFERQTLRIHDVPTGALLAELPLPPSPSDRIRSYQVVEPYLRVGRRLYLAPTTALELELPRDVDLKAAAGCYLAGSSENRNVEGSVLWWLDVCGPTPRYAVGFSPDQLLPAWVPTPEGLWVQEWEGNWRFFTPGSW